MALTAVESNRLYRQRHPEKVSAGRHRRRLKDKYDMTPEDYAEMLASQRGVCAVCKRECRTGRRLAVDHDHATKKIRGLLCLHCNRAIGLIHDDPEIADALATYLRRFNS